MLRTWLARAATVRPDGAFLEDARSERQVTYAEQLAAGERWSATLDDLGLGRGARVALVRSNVVDYGSDFVGILSAGRVVVPVDPKATPDEWRKLIEISGATGLATDAGLMVVGDPPRPPSTGRQDTPDGAKGGVYLLTSGTTGAPKGIALSEDQLCHVASAIATHHGLGPSDRGFNPLPLFHVNAEVVGLLATLASAACLVLDDRFHRTGFWPLVEQRRATWVNAAPAIIAILATDPESQVAGGTPLIRFFRSASAPLPAATLERFEALFGVPVLETYGMTEACSMITANPVAGVRKPGSVGLPVTAEVRVVAGTARLPSGEAGRVQIRGPGVITEYARGGAGAFTEDGWLDTGDLGYFDDDGYLHLLGRSDDVINRGGEKIHPRQIEEVILEDGRVEAVAVVGKPDPILGERPVAFVVAAAPGTIETLVDDLERRCRDRLASWKCPSEIALVEALPAGPTGKISRARVRRELLLSPAGAGGDGEPSPQYIMRGSR